LMINRRSIWRGTIVIGDHRQFLRFDVMWGELDILSSNRRRARRDASLTPTQKRVTSQGGGDCEHSAGFVALLYVQRGIASLARWKAAILASSRHELLPLSPLWERENGSDIFGLAAVTKLGSSVGEVPIVADLRSAGIRGRPLACANPAIRSRKYSAKLLAKCRSSGKCVWNLAEV